MTPPRVPGLDDDDFSEESNPDDVIQDADVVEGELVEPASSESAEDFEGAADPEMERRRRREERGEDLERHFEHRPRQARGKKRTRRPRNPAATARYAPSEKWVDVAEAGEEILRKARDHRGEVVPWSEAEEILRPLRMSWRESESSSVRLQRRWNAGERAEEEERARAFREVEQVLEPEITKRRKKKKHGRRGGTGRKPSGTNALRTDRDGAPDEHRFLFVKEGNAEAAIHEWLCARLAQRGELRFTVPGGKGRSRTTRLH